MVKPVYERSTLTFFVQFDGMEYQEIVDIPIGTKCASFIADWFFVLFEKDFISHLQKSKGFDLMHMFNDTSRDVDYTFTIDNPEFDKHIPNIYPAGRQLNKADTSDNQTKKFLLIFVLIRL